MPSTSGWPCTYERRGRDQIEFQGLNRVAIDADLRAERRQQRPPVRALQELPLGQGLDQRPDGVQVQRGGARFRYGLQEQVPIHRLVAAYVPEPPVALLPAYRALEESIEDALLLFG